MKQKEIKEIARIINRYSEEIVPDLEDGKPIPTDVNVFVNSKVLSQALADYLEREVNKINKERTERYLKEHKGSISEKALVYFNREQFLKWCGVKE